MKSILRNLYFPLVLPFTLIFFLGVLTLSSVAPLTVNSQLEALVVGLVGMVVFTLLDYRILKNFSKVLYIVGLCFLLLTFAFGKIVGGSERWLQIGGFTFQTSELAKLTLVVFLAGIISKDPKYIKTPSFTFLLFFAILLYLVLILIQPDLGTTLIVFSAAFGLLLLAGLNKLYVISAVSAVGIFSNPLWNLLHDYQQKRILIFLNPLLDTQGAGYNVIQSKIAVGAGQLFGEGIGRGMQSHLQYLPAYWTDFIFASYAEEWGFVGVLFLFGLFFAFLSSILYLMTKTTDTFGYLLAGGIFTIFFAQFFINVGMNLGVMPVTGIPLPFVSYGGTSLVISMCMIGILQSIWVHRKIT
ncbi:rod shape-determining protein RodA [Patescibacteria group bacterium]|nr:rod shape-determining protein RodA [Patescibacteria group bacterium]